MAVWRGGGEEKILIFVNSQDPHECIIDLFNIFSNFYSKKFYVRKMLTAKTN